MLATLTPPGSVAIIEVHSERSTYCMSFAARSDLDIASVRCSLDQDDLETGGVKCFCFDCVSDQAMRISAAYWPIGIWSPRQEEGSPRAPRFYPL